MKKLVGLLLTVAMLATLLVVPMTASAAALPEFVIDGNLDVWYLKETPEGDLNDGYYFSTFDDTMNCISKADGMSAIPVEDAVTCAELYTAYDENYIYVYIRVWDDELISYDPQGAHAGMDSSAADYCEIWLDPDPNSQTEGKAPDEIKDGWWQQTNDPNQADIQMRMNGNDLKIDDFHNFAKPGYEGVTFGKWISNPENCVGFHFEDELPPNDTACTATSGFGIEARFPRNDDKSNCYKINCSCGTSCEFEEDRYVWCLGRAWWLDYAQAVIVRFNDMENPFFEQDVTGKEVIYADQSKGNAAGQAVIDQIDALPAAVSDADKDTVIAIREAYDALSDIQKGFVKTKNYEDLAAAEKALGIGEPDGDKEEMVADLVKALGKESYTQASGITMKMGDVEGIPALVFEDQKGSQMEDFPLSFYDIKKTDAGYALVGTDGNPSEKSNLAFTVAGGKVTSVVISGFPNDPEHGDKTPLNGTYAVSEAKVTLGDINGDGKINAADALLTLKAAVGKVTLTKDQITAADVNKDGKVNASDALAILKKSVGKPAGF